MNGVQIINENLIIDKMENQWKPNIVVVYAQCP